MSGDLGPSTSANLETEESACSSRKRHCDENLDTGCIGGCGHAPCNAKRAALEPPTAADAGADSVSTSSSSQPSCSSSQVRWWYIKLDPASDNYESDTPDSLAEESIWSNQDANTEPIKSSASDLSDLEAETRWRATHRIEFEIASDPSSEDERPFKKRQILDSGSSTTCSSDLEAAAAVFAAVTTEALCEYNADSSSDMTDPELEPNDKWACLQCGKKNQPIPRYCQHCFAVRKKWFPPRPRRRAQARKKAELSQKSSGSSKKEGTFNSQEPIASTSKSHSIFGPTAAKRSDSDSVSSFDSECGDSQKIDEHVNSSQEIIEETKDERTCEPSNSVHTQSANDVGPENSTAFSSTVSQTSSLGFDYGEDAVDFPTSKNEKPLCENKVDALIPMRAQSEDVVDLPRKSMWTQSPCEDVVDFPMKRLMPSFSGRDVLNARPFNTEEEDDEDVVDCPLPRTMPADIGNGSTSTSLGSGNLDGTESSEISSGINTSISANLSPEGDDAKEGNSTGATVHDGLSLSGSQSLTSSQDTVCPVKMCIVCENNTANTAFVHVRVAHQCACYPCAKKVYNTSGLCPICRKAASSFVRVYSL